MPSAFSEALALIAREELEQYGGMPATQSPLTERIDAYWRFLGYPDLHGFAWSAAFISYMVHLAGGEDRFHYTFRHSDYIYRAINTHLARQGGAFIGLRADERPIEPGDIVGMNRSEAEPIEYDWAAEHERYKSHCDIVISAGAEGLVTVGGNVAEPPGYVGTKTFVWRKGVLVNPLKPNQQIFVVIRNALP
jgi:hypothetical protein